MGTLNTGPTWLMAALDQRLAKLEDCLPSEVVGLLGFDVVTLHLTEFEEGATDDDIKKWDETCDNCGKHVPGQLYSGRAEYVRNGTPVIIFFGCCVTCREAP